jgi:hypothetical protein
MKLNLLTFYTEDFKENAKKLMASAKKVGFDECIGLTPTYLKGRRFEEQNKHILEKKRGAGYWVWKPYIIKEQLKKLKKDELLLYCDAGRTSYYEFDTYPSQLISYFHKKNKGYLLGPAAEHFGPLGMWTKSECLKLMNADELIQKKPLLMTWGIWSNCVEANSFLDLWLQYVQDPRCLLDDNNEDQTDRLFEYKGHRHDQSILSILCHQTNAPYIETEDSITNKLLTVKPRSALAMNFYKRPQNVNSMLSGNEVFILIKEYFRLKDM